MSFWCNRHQVEAPSGGTGCRFCYAEWQLRRDPSNMTPAERVMELERWCSQVSIPLECIFQRISELVGRPVLHHEIALSYSELCESAYNNNGGTCA